MFVVFSSVDFEKVEPLRVVFFLFAYLSYAPLDFYGSRPALKTNLIKARCNAYQCILRPSKLPQHSEILCQQLETNKGIGGSKRATFTAPTTNMKTYEA